MDSYQSNQSLYNKCISKKCKKHAFCSYNKMTPIMDPTAAMTQPNLYGT